MVVVGEYRHVNRLVDRRRCTVVDGTRRIGHRRDAELQSIRSVRKCAHRVLDAELELGIPSTVAVGRRHEAQPPRSKISGTDDQAGAGDRRAVITQTAGTGQRVDPHRAHCVGVGIAVAQVRLSNDVAAILGKYHRVVRARRRVVRADGYRQRRRVRHAARTVADRVADRNRPVDRDQRCEGEGVVAIDRHGALERVHGGRVDYEAVAVDVVVVGQHGDRNRSQRRGRCTVVHRHRRIGHRIDRDRKAARRDIGAVGRRDGHRRRPAVLRGVGVRRRRQRDRAAPVGPSEHDAGVRQQRSVVRAGRDDQAARRSLGITDGEVQRPQRGVFVHRLAGDRGDRRRGIAHVFVGADVRSAGASHTALVGRRRGRVADVDGRRSRKQRMRRCEATVGRQRAQLE